MIFKQLFADGPASTPRTISALARDVRYFLELTPRQLPSRYLYDPLGSCLFEAICRLPWYGITRAENELLTRHAAAIGSELREPASIIELGCGSGEKLARLITSMPARSTPLDLHLVDVSATALALSQRALSALTDARVFVHQSTYETGMRAAAHYRADRTVMLLFLGSNIGNFDPAGAAAFLAEIRETLRSGDRLLLGADLLKPEAELLRAYDDPLGVTAAFNKNLLVRINRELEADFKIDGFDHRVVWNAEPSRIEMHLVSRRSQTVSIPGADLVVPFQHGELIWTESSYKYDPGELISMVEPHGFGCRRQWLHETARFALTLFEAI
jgi:dimethylhistidine N-methyltransferase